MKTTHALRKVLTEHFKSRQIPIYDLPLDQHPDGCGCGCHACPKCFKPLRKGANCPCSVVCALALL